MDDYLELNCARTKLLDKFGYHCPGAMVHVNC